MSVKFLSRLGKSEIFELFLKVCNENKKQVRFRKIERRKDGFVLHIESAGDLLSIYCQDFDVISNVCFMSDIDYDLWRLLLYKKFGAEYAVAFFEEFVKENGL